MRWLSEYYANKTDDNNIEEDFQIEEEFTSNNEQDVPSYMVITIRGRHNIEMIKAAIEGVKTFYKGYNKKEVN